MPFDPMYASFFSLEIDSTKIAFFTGCSGLNIEFEVAAFKQVAGKNLVNRKSPGKVKFSEVVMKRGYTTDMVVHKWFDEVVAAKDKQEKFMKTASIVMYSRDMKEVARFNLLNCWPSKISMSDLDAGGNEVIVEELTIQHESIDWVS